MTDVTRRDAMKAMAALPFALAWDLTPPQLERATRAFVEDGQAYAPTFFTSGEWETVRMLVDYVIPRDERSGSATEAKVPEYMDFIFSDKDASESSKVAMRGGLGWLDFECRERFGATFVRCTDQQRRDVLDDIAWPARAKPEHSHGTAFFTRFRDLTAGGFFSSVMGWQDVRFVGNVFNPDWQGCSAEAMAKLGVSQELMKTRIPVQ